MAKKTTTSGLNCVGIATGLKPFRDSKGIYYIEGEEYTTSGKKEVCHYTIESRNGRALIGVRIGNQTEKNPTEADFEAAIESIQVIAKTKPPKDPTNLVLPDQPGPSATGPGREKWEEDKISRHKPVKSFMTMLEERGIETFLDENETPMMVIPGDKIGYACEIESKRVEVWIGGEYEKSRGWPPSPHEVKYVLNRLQQMAFHQSIQNPKDGKDLESILCGNPILAAVKKMLNDTNYIAKEGPKWQDAEELYYTMKSKADNHPCKKDFPGSAAWLRRALNGLEQALKDIFKLKFETRRKEYGVEWSFTPLIATSPLQGEEAPSEGPFPVLQVSSEDLLKTAEDIANVSTGRKSKAGKKLPKPEATVVMEDESSDSQVE